MAAAIVLPAAIAAGHAAYSYWGWTIIVGRDDPLAGITYVPSLALAVTYLLAVFVGRRLMQSRPALNPFYAMQIYNVYEAALSAYMTWLFVSETFLAGRSPFAAPVDRSAAGSKLAFALWLNYTSKFTEFADTLFMVLRKKDVQISTLHLVHHAEMGPLMLLFCRIAPGGGSAFGPMINSGIHTVMYSYYAVTTAGYRPSWKWLLTAAQIAQFLVIAVHAGYHLATRGAYWDATLAFIELLLMVQMIFMFGDFFRSTYGGKSQKPKAKGAAHAANGDANGANGHVTNGSRKTE